jgi:formylglycine-generating enzyme required for sulfatase activity
MARIEKTVFISYRRTDVYTALAVYESLKNQGYDVFFDYRSIPSGDFEQIITSNIRARAHFLLILTPTALDGCNEPGDWLRREIEIAIDEKRNIVPLFFKGFRFGAPSVTEQLTGKLKNLNRYNGLNVHEDYFEEAMQRVRTQFLSRPLDTVLHPVSTEVQRVVQEEQNAADEALKHRDDIKALVKSVKGKVEQSRKSLSGNALFERIVSPLRKVNPRSYRIGAGILLVIVLGMAGINSWIQNSLGNETPLSTETPELVVETTPSQAGTIPTSPSTSPIVTTTPTLIITATATQTLGVGSTLISDTDGMTLLYVPAGEFTMGSDSGEDDEKPVHTVFLDAFWIDRTEITNAMYAKCVDADVCVPPASTESYTRDRYYGNSDFDDYPVTNVAWIMAKSYCEWANRRLPTEAEWEKAARGENALVYPWGTNFDGTRVNFCDNNCSFNWADKSSNDGYADTAPVGSYSNGASPYGILDMAGNVWEWVNDWYDSSYYENSPESNPQGPSTGVGRVLRGGAWADTNVRSADRDRSVPTFALNWMGFRCAMSATP